MNHNGEIPVRYYDRVHFGDTEESSDMLCRLILEGRKTASCSALWEYEADNEPLSKPGTRLNVIDGQTCPQGVIEITEVEIRAFREVDAEFAYDEGEGDRSLESWREEHWRFFMRSLRRINRKPSLDMPLVCARFRLVPFHYSFV
jgi:uncharacterized protein YhfF